MSPHRVGVWESVVFAAVFCAGGWAQYPDWSDDVVVFGTDDDERHPCITAIADGTMRAFCIADNQTPRFRISNDNGITWNAFESLPTSPECRLFATSDADRFYALANDSDDHALILYTWSGPEMEWDSVTVVRYDDNDSPMIQSPCIVSDIAFDAQDPYLSLSWIERNEVTNEIQARFCQSRDLGGTVTTPVTVRTASDDSGLDNNVSLAVSWDGQEETWWLGATVDRMGSVPEQAVAYSSADQGAHWSGPVVLDSSSYPQVGLSLCAHGNLLMAAYARRVNAASQREIFYTYSLDGGALFAEPTPLTSSANDDFAPQVVICTEPERVGIFYLTAEVQQDPSTLRVMEADLSTPWLFSDAADVCEAGAASRSGGFHACATANGFAVVWAGQGVLGDDDVWFDAGWRGQDSESGFTKIPAAFQLGSAFPNPFNSIVTLPIAVDRPSRVILEMRDVLGREAERLDLGWLTSGDQNVRLNLTGRPSGVYWIVPAEFPRAAIRVNLVK